jgi:hypothetical protein
VEVISLIKLLIFNDLIANLQVCIPFVPAFIPSKSNFPTSFCSFFPRGIGLTATDQPVFR